MISLTLIIRIDSISMILGTRSNKKNTGAQTKGKIIHISSSNKGSQFPSSTTLWSQDSLNSIQDSDSPSFVQCLDEEEDANMSHDSMNSSEEVNSFSNSYEEDSVDNVQWAHSSRSYISTKKLTKSSSAASLYKHTRSSNNTRSSKSVKENRGSVRRNNTKMNNIMNTFKKTNKNISESVRQLNGRNGKSSRMVNHTATNGRKKGKQKDRIIVPRTGFNENIVIQPELSSPVSSYVTTPFDSSFPMTDQLVNDAIAFLTS